MSVEEDVPMETKGSMKWNAEYVDKMMKSLFELVQNSSRLVLEDKL